MERETNVVLQSIFPPQSLGAFASQPRMDKRTQLRELTAIVTGIRERDGEKTATVIAVQGSAKRWALGCVNSPRGKREPGGGIHAT